MCEGGVKKKEKQTLNLNKWSYHIIFYNSTQLTKTYSAAFWEFIFI